MEGSTDLYATPTTQLHPDEHFRFAEQHFLSFGTSHARQDVSFAQEGGNQYDGLDQYNPHFTSLVTTPITCLKDDEDFVSSIGGKGPLSCGRLKFLWQAVYRFCDRNHDLALQTWLKLLEGGTGDDIWLWVDGDEEIISMEERNSWSMYRIRMPTPTEWRKAASALSKRLERVQVGGSRDREEAVHLAERRRRVQEADPRIRFSMISWIVASSEAMRDTDASRGLNHRWRWDLNYLISTWVHTVKPCWFPVTTLNDVFQTFDDAMKRAGHSCHQFSQGIKMWTWMRSFLVPDQRYDVVYLSLTIESLCKACAARNRSLSPSFLPSHNTSTSGESVDLSGVADYQPPHYLVFLWILWSGINRHRNSTKFSKWFEYLDLIACQSSSPLFRVSTLKSVDLWLGKFSSGSRHGQWLPWVNFYPESCRRDCTVLTSRDWQRAQASVQSASAAGTCQEVEQSSMSDTHDLPTSVDIGTWIGAVILSMLPKRSERDSKPSKKVREFMWAVNGYSMDDFLRSVPEVEPTKAVTNFRCAVQESHHTCYQRFSPATLDWYASAVSLTNNTDDIKFVPLGNIRSCAPCKMANNFRCLVKNVSTSTKHQLVVQELSAIAAQEGLRFESLADDSRLEGPSSPMEDNPGESDDADGSDNMHTSDVVHSASAMSGGLGDQRQSRATETSQNSETTRNVGVLHEPKVPRRPKGFMIKEIKVYIIKLLEDLEIPILGLKNKQLPWTTLPRVLAKCGWELDNWPNGVPLPGSGDQSCDDNKGINGLDMMHINLLYDAMKSETYPLGFRRIINTTSPTTGVSQSSEGSAPAGEDDSQDCTPIASNEGSRESAAAPFDTSRKRSYDTRDVSDIERGLGKRQRMLETDFYS